MFTASASSFPQGGYYIAAPYPGPSSSSGSEAYSLNPNMPPRTTTPPTTTPTQGFIYGPYSYPYSGQPGGRVVGPVIALAAPGSIPVASVASSSILSSSDSSLDQMGGFALQSGPLVGPARQNLQTAARPSSNTQNASQNVSPAGLGIGGKPQGKAAPIMASSTMSSSLSLSSTAPTSMRQILPKDKARVGQSPSIARPTQIVGPIAASSSTVPPPTPQSLVAALLPTQIQTNKKQTSGQQLGAENNKQMNHHLHSTSKQTNKLADEQSVPRLYSMSTSEKAIAEANAVSSKKQAQAFSMPTSKQAHAQLHSTGKQMQAQVHITPTSKQTPVQLYSTPTSKH